MPLMMDMVAKAKKVAKRARRVNVNSKEKTEAMKKEKEEMLVKKREEAERKARRGEIDPTHEFTFFMISQVSSVLLPHRHLGRIFADIYCCFSRSVNS